MIVVEAPATDRRRPATDRRPRRSKLDPVTRYALDVLDGRIVAGRLARLACERHLDDIVRGPERGLTWDPGAAQVAIDFFGLLHHYEGRDDLIVLEAWQQFVVGSAFGWKRADGTRRFRTVYLECASKQGKSTLAAGVGLKLAFFDGEPGAKVYAAATKRDQAKFVWSAARAMVRKSPALLRRIRVGTGRLWQEGTNSIFAPLGRDSDSDQGLNPNGAIIDELHVHDSRDLMDNIEKAASVRRQPQIWKITTAGNRRHGVYVDERRDAVAILERRVEDDSTFAIIYALDRVADGADRDDDPFDESVWTKANPNLGVSVGWDFLRERAAKAKRSPGALSAYLRYHMNLPGDESSKAIAIDVWDAATYGPDPDDPDGDPILIEPAIPAGAEIYVALDLASVRDLTAAAVVYREPGTDVFHAVMRFWCPEVGIDDRSRLDGVPYDQWVKDGWMIATPGNVTDYSFVRAFALELADGFDVREIAYDRWNATQLITDLQEDGAICIPISQTTAGLAAGWRDLERSILAAKLRHGAQPVLRWMAGNVEIETDASGNQKPSKAKSKERIDGMVALTMAIGRAIANGDPIEESSS